MVGVYAEGGSATGVSGIEDSGVECADSEGGEVGVSSWGVGTAAEG